jgi:hypothetical protein
VIDRSYERRKAMAEGTAIFFACVIALGIFGTVIYVVAHFVSKYW